MHCYLLAMSSLAEIEKYVSPFSAEELRQIACKARRQKVQAQKLSPGDTDLVGVGTIGRPTGR